MLPVALGAASVAKKGQQALKQWSELPAADREEVKAEALEVKERLRDLVGAVTTTDSRSSSPVVEDWDEALAAGLNPPAAFNMASKIVETLRSLEAGRSGLKTSQLAAATGAAGKTDPVFREGVHIAEADGYIRDVFFAGWQLTEFADQELCDAEHVQALEQRIVAYVTAVGITDRPQMADAVGAESHDAADFLAALERALTAGKIAWLNWGHYGLPREQLSEFRRPDEKDEVRGTAVPRREAAADVKAAAASVAIAVEALGAKLLTTRQKKPISLPSDESRMAPLEELKQLAELKNAGVLTEDELAEKKAELLRRM